MFKFQKLEGDVYVEYENGDRSVGLFPAWFISAGDDCLTLDSEDMRKLAAILNEAIAAEDAYGNNNYVKSQPCPGCNSHKVISAGKGISGDYRINGNYQGIDISELRCTECGETWWW